MRIWDVAVDNKVSVYILIALIVIVGAGSYIGMPREAAPDITIPLVIVSVPYPGVSPTDMEGLVAQPLERELKSLKDIKQITSSSSEGLSSVRVEFNTGVDIDEALRRVRDKVNSTKPKLPSDILEPIVKEINISEFPIMYITVGGDIGLAKLKKIADDLQEKIEGIPGVISATINGALEPEVQINCDVNKLKGYDVSFDDVVNAIRSENLNVPGGSIDNGKTDFTVRIPGEYTNPKPIGDIIVKMRNRQPIYVRDVARVDYSFEDRTTYSRLNGKAGVTIGVSKRAGENLVRIADQVKEILKAQEVHLPSGVRIEITNDQSIAIKRMVTELENSILTGMFLVVVALFMFFGLKNSMLISTAIPLSMLIGFIVLSLLNITLNFVVLFSLVFVLGIIVDDAIVVIENIYRHQHEYGKKPFQAAKDAAKEVAVPVATSTFTTLAAFIPLMFWPGIVGDFMKYLPITLIATMLASLFVAYVISPVQGAQWIDYHKEIQKAKRDLEHPHWWKKYNPFTFLYHWVDTKMFPAAQRRYVKTLRWTLQRKGFTVAGAFGFLIIMTIIFVLFNNGVEFFPNTQPNLVSVDITMPPGTPLNVTNGVTQLVEERIEQIKNRKDVEFVVANVGTSSDVFDFGGKSTANKARVSINFYEKAKRNENTFKTLEEIRMSTSTIPGGDILTQRQQMGPPVGAPVSIEIAGTDFAKLNVLSLQIQKIIKDIPGLVDLKDDYNAGKPEIQVIVDREKAALLEMNTRQIAMAVRSAINGIEASKYRVGEDEYKITVRLEKDQRESVKDLENLSITFMNKRGQILTIPLVSVANIVRSSGLSSIRRKDLKRVITITGDAQGRLANDVLKDVRARLANFELPSEYSINFSGEQEEQNKAAAFLSRSFIIAIFLVFLILVSEFNSIKVPAVIMISVVLTFIGVFFGLLVTRQPFGIIMNGVGIVALAGIVVKNAIMLMDFTKQLRAKGLPLDEALVEAGRVRLRPVALTATAAVLAVVPLGTGIDFDWAHFHFVIGAESADFWRPFAVAIIFGLTVSTVLTLVIIPTFYSWVEDKNAQLVAAMKRLFGRKKIEPASSEG